ncbi:MAG: amidohydrolase family protein [Bacillota bacterium]
MKRLVKSRAIFTATDKNMINKGWLVIEEGIIQGLGGPEQRPDREFVELEDRVIDLSDYYLLPGLIDCHTHLSITPALGNQLEQLSLPGQTNILRSIPNLYRDLAAGATTIRVMGEENYIDIDIKQAIEQGLIQGPRLLTSGIGIVATNGHGAAHTVCDGRQEIQKQIRRNFARGADLVKLFATGGVSSRSSTLDLPGYSRKEIRTAVEEANMAGSYVAAHAHGGKGMDYCIEEGVRTLEHAAFVNERQLEQIADRDLWVVGTFSILFHPEGIEKNDLKNPSIRDKVMKAREFIRENFSQVLKSGVNLAVGTDSMHGHLAWELEFLNKLGLGPERALLVVTREAARACQIEDRLGTLAPGKIADFIAIRGNPLEDLGNLRNIEAVFKEGKEVRVD